MNAMSDDSALRKAIAADSQPLGDLLVSAGHLKRDQIDLVLFKQRREGLMFGEAAISLGLISEEQLEHALLQQYCPFGIPQETDGLDASLHAALNPFGHEAEAIRRLRSQLNMCWFGRGENTLAICGARAGDGCSAIAANLAVAFAQLGKRTLLIDANMRRPVQHSLFGVALGTGLSSVLTKRAQINSALRSIPSLPGLTLLTAGPIPPNPQELLGGAMFSYVMETTPSVFDVVIVDTPAVRENADAEVIAMRAGACLLSMQRHHTSCEDLAKVKEFLAPTGVVLLGAVLNG
jgi:chain length determinant protein tyrosine kinase EpsG